MPRPPGGLGGAEVNLPHDDTSPEDLMRRLQEPTLTHKDCQMLLQHPRLPLRGLVQLGPIDPELFFAHPTVRLVMATDPGFLKRLDAELQVHLIRHSDLAGPETLRRLAGSRQDPTPRRMAAAESPVLPPDLALDYPGHSAKVRRSLASNPVLPRQVVEILAHDKDAQVRVVVALRRDLHDLALSELVQDPSPQVRWTVAGNPTCRGRHLEALLHDRIAAIRVRARRFLGGSRIDRDLAEWMIHQACCP